HRRDARRWARPGIPATPPRAPVHAGRDGAPARARGARDHRADGRLRRRSPARRRRDPDPSLPGGAVSGPPRAVVRLGHLYPAQMSIYADRGNIAVLARRLEWRGYELEVTELGPGTSAGPGAHDLYYLGGGQDRDQARVAEDLLASKGAGLRAAV